MGTDHSDSEAVKDEDGDGDIAMGNAEVKSEPKSSQASNRIVAEAATKNEGKDKKPQLINGKPVGSLQFPRTAGVYYLQATPRKTPLHSRLSIQQPHQNALRPKPRMKTKMMRSQ